MPSVGTMETTIWDALFAKLKAETNINPTTGAAGTGTNTTGRLQTCADIRRSIHLWTKRLPAIGVQAVGWDAAEDATSKRLVTFKFNIIAHLEWTASMSASNAPANLDDAWTTLQSLLADGNGNGIEAILNDPANYTLGVSGVITTKLGKLDRVWRIGEGQVPQIQAWALYEYEAQANVYVGS